MGKIIAEYQDLKDRQKNHNAFWRFFHRTENKDRNALIEKMGKFIREQLLEGMKNINLDEAVPALVSRKLADARIRGEVEVAGPRRLDPTTATRVFGCSPASEDIVNQQKLFDELAQKVPMSGDVNFMNDVIGSDNVKMNQVPKEKVYNNPSLVKD